jgi:putative peptide zinc metalloprotease protein
VGIFAPTTEANARTPDSPRLREGTELLGPYEDSGFTTPQFLVRRHDGQVIRVSQLLYLITAQMDGRQDLDAIAHQVSEQLDRKVTARDVEHLVATKLDKLGIVDGTTEATTYATADPLLGLRFRAGLVPERMHRGITTVLRPAFAPAVVTAVLVALAGVDVWLIAHRRSALMTGLVEILSRPGMFLVFIAATFVGMAFHEFGHATACRYSGGRPGAMGVGVYIGWPAFYTDVSDAYRLNRRGRLRTDLGGIYFNAIFALMIAGAYLATGFAPLVVMSALTQVQAIYQLVPFVRLDGYYILGDLIGVPNPFAYVRATFLALFASRHSDARTRAQASLHTLKRSARITLTVWILLAVPALLAGLAFSVYLLPRTVPVIYSTLRLDAHVVSTGVAHGDWVRTANGAVQFLFLTLPILGWLSTLWFFVKYVATKPWARNLFRPRAWARPVTIAVAAAVVVGAFAVTLQLRSSSTPTAETGSSPAIIEVQAADLVPPVNFGAPAEVGTSTLGAVEASAAQTPGVSPPSTTPPTAQPVTQPLAAPAAVPGPTRWALSMPVADINSMADSVPHHDTTIGTWHVQSGDDFWHMAEQILTDAYRRAPTPAEHGAYWVQLVEANRDRLVNADDASTIFAGQDFAVILPALTPTPGGSMFAPP